MRIEAPIKINGQKLQDLFIETSEVKANAREVREGRSDKHFDSMDMYLRVYHGFDNFQLVEGERKGDEFRLRIRRIGLLERIRNFLKG